MPCWRRSRPGTGPAAVAGRLAARDLDTARTGCLVSDRRGDAGPRSRCCVAGSPSRGGYFLDDFAFTGFAPSYPVTAVHDFLLKSYNGHLMPGAFVQVWLMTKAFPLNFAVVVAVDVVLQVLVGLAVLAVLRELFGSRPVILVPFTVYLFTPMTLPAFVWWAAALNQLPQQLATALAIWCQLRYLRTGRVRTGLLGVLAVADRPAVLGEDAVRGAGGGGAHACSGSPAAGRCRGCVGVAGAPSGMDRLPGAGCGLRRLLRDRGAVADACAGQPERRAAAVRLVALALDNARPARRSMGLAFDRLRRSDSEPDQVRQPTWPAAWWYCSSPAASRLYRNAVFGWLLPVGYARDRPRPAGLEPGHLHRAVHRRRAALCHRRGDDRGDRRGAGGASRWPAAWPAPNRSTRSGDPGWHSFTARPEWRQAAAELSLPRPAGVIGLVLALILISAGYSTVRYDRYWSTNPSRPYLAALRADLARLPVGHRAGRSGGAGSGGLGTAVPVQPGIQAAEAAAQPSGVPGDRWQRRSAGHHRRPGPPAAAAGAGHLRARPARPGRLPLSACPATATVPLEQPTFPWTWVGRLRLHRLPGRCGPAAGRYHRLAVRLHKGANTVYFQVVGAISELDVYGIPDGATVCENGLVIGKPVPVPGSVLP